MAYPDLQPIGVVDDNVTINTSNLTSNSIEGTGVFDTLMRSVNKHLINEYENNRITGEQYAQVYLGSLSSVLQQSVAYLFNLKQEKKIDADIGLVRQKIVTELAQTDNTIPVDLGFNGDSTVEGVIASQLAVTAKQESLLDAQILSATAEKDLVGQKIVTELAQTDDNLATAIATYGFNTTGSVSGSVKLKNEQITAETDLINQKIVTELGQSSLVKPTTLGQSSSTTINSIIEANKNLIDAQKSKAEQEVILLKQKTATELAQTSNTIPANTGVITTAVDLSVKDTGDQIGVIGHQKALYKQQSAGFQRDAEQKLTKILMDAFITEASINGRTGDSDSYINNINLGEVVYKAAQGVGINLTTVTP